MKSPIGGRDDHGTGPSRRCGSRSRIESLIDRLEGQHDAIRGPLTEIADRLEAVARRHATKHPEVLPLVMIFNDFKTELVEHLERAEHGLFRLARGLCRDSGDGAGDRIDRIDRIDPTELEALRRSVSAMSAEQDATLAELEAMHRMTLGFAVPDDGDDDFERAYSSLKQLHELFRGYRRLERQELVPWLRARMASLTEELET